VILAIAVPTTVLLSACGSSNSASDATAAANGNARDCKALRLYTWEGQAPAGLLGPFEKKYGVPVKVSYMTSAAQALAKLAAGGTKQIDLISNEASVLKPSVEAGVIKPIDLSKVPEFSKLFKFDAEPFKVEGKYYGVPSLWGVNKFIYSTDVIKKPPTSWKELWNPKLKDQVGLWEDVSMLYIGAAVLGYNKDPEQLWNLSQEQLDKIRDKLLELKGNVRSVWNSGGDLIQLMANHEVAASPDWGGYMYPELKKQGQPVAEAVPDDIGAQAWAEAMQMSSDISPDCEAAAYAFVNEMATPQRQAVLVNATGYSPSNPGAAKYLSKAKKEEVGLNDVQAFRGNSIVKQAPTDSEAYDQTLQEVISGLG
jgi:putative spermidine/putrescine transport system substrate-binding protein/spermidine/putrescine transport system substrate-binding protein